MEYNFDEIIDRRNTNSENMDGWRTYIFKDDPDRVFSYKDDEFIRMWVADMEFAVTPDGSEHFLGVPPASKSVPSRLPIVMSASFKMFSVFSKILASFFGSRDNSG